MNLNYIIEKDKDKDSYYVYKHKKEIKLDNTFWLFVILVNVVWISIITVLLLHNINIYATVLLLIPFVFEIIILINYDELDKVPEYKHTIILVVLALGILGWVYSGRNVGKVVEISLILAVILILLTEVYIPLHNSAINDFIQFSFTTMSVVLIIFSIFQFIKNY